jgi:hypothetical protein
MDFPTLNYSLLVLFKQLNMQVGWQRSFRKVIVLCEFVLR